MAKYEITLGTGLRVRAELMKVIRGIEANLGSGEVYALKEDIPMLKERFHTGSFETEWALYELLQTSRQNIADAIEESNVKGQKVLNEITRINALINTADGIIFRLKRGDRVVRRDNPVTGCQERREKEPVMEHESIDKLKTLVADLSKEKLKAEHRLNEYNATTKIVVELEEEIAALIGL